MVTAVRFSQPTSHRGQAGDSIERFDIVFGTWEAPRNRLPRDENVIWRDWRSLFAEVSPQFPDLCCIAPGQVRNFESKRVHGGNVYFDTLAFVATETKFMHDNNR